MSMTVCISPLELKNYRQKLKCNFEQVDTVFPDCMENAITLLSEQGIEDYLEGASLVTMIGRGFDPILTYLEEMPEVASLLGEEMLSIVSQAVWKMSRTPNGKAIPSFLQTIGEVSRRLGSVDSIKHYIELIFDMMEQTTKSIHGFHATYPSPGLTDLLNNTPYLLQQLSLAGLKNWITYGVRNYNNHPERQKDFFTLQSADSRAVLQRERHGTLFVDNERKLDMYMRAFWASDNSEFPYLVPYSEAFDQLRKPQPYFDKLGLRIPDVYDDKNKVTGINRYRLTLAHMAGHQVWSKPMVADNYSPFQRISTETFEDARIDYLLIQRFPGLKKTMLALHPEPDEFACNPKDESCILHRLSMVSFAMLNSEHNYKNPFVIEFSNKFREAMNKGESSSKEMASLALSFTARTRLQSDQSANIHFKDSEICYRDDNRHLWVYIEEGDEEEAFEKHEQKSEETDHHQLPPRHYPEWDYNNSNYRPDWVSLYESLHPSGNAADIDNLLNKHAMLLKRLKAMMELLKPQQYKRVRYQEDGSELDLDVAIRSLIDFKSGSQPDPRINMSYKHDGRDIAVMLLLDLSASLNDIPKGCEQSILELSKEAVSLLSTTIEGLGDKFAIAGFSSNSRHEVRYQHIKGYSEQWSDEVKSRLAALEAGYSTRMGAAMRHAAHYLGAQKADKKLLLILTDGEPADIDVDDENLLIQDAHRAVQELDQDGIYTYCINLNPHADDYVTEVFGKQYTVIDHVEKLPEKLPMLFAALTT